MNAIAGFVSAALPYLAVGLLLAIFFARSARKKKDGKKQGDDCATEGMCLGMAIGGALGESFGWGTGLGLSLGMLIGLAVGTCIPKDTDDGDDNSKNKD